MLANMACSLIEEGQIRTTVTKAKELRRVVERMITLGKRGSLHARRQAIAKLRQPATVRVLFDEVAPKFAERNGGYTRILKLNERIGDAAEMCLIQLVTEPVTPKVKPVKEAPAAAAAAEPETVEAAAETAEEAAVAAEEAGETGEAAEAEAVEESAEAGAAEEAEAEAEASEETTDEEQEKK
jgi:large subunit ribosomal protein L17